MDSFLCTEVNIKIKTAVAKVVLHCKMVFKAKKT